MIKTIAAESDTGNKTDEIMKTLQQKYGDEFVDEWSAKLYTVLMDKAEGEAYDKIKGIIGRDGVEGYCRIYQWFTEISGLGLAEQARRLMHPDPPKTEEKLAEFIDNWCEGNRRLEAHGSRYILPPLYRFAAFRMMMVRRSRDHFEMWQAECADDDDGFEKLMGKVKDYARRRKLDDSATKAVQSGHNLMDCGGVHQGCGGGQAAPAGGDQQAPGAGGVQDWSYWGWPGIDAVGKGKGKGKGGFQGHCYNCGEY